MNFHFRRFFFVLAFASCICWAQGDTEEKHDELGCYTDSVTESYICDEGPLIGREFLSKAEALEALQGLKAKQERYKQATAEITPPTDEPPLKPEKPPLPPTPAGAIRVMSWNMKALSHDDSDYDRAALVLADADLISLQDFDLHTAGKGFLNVMADLVQSKSKEKICRAWVHAGNGERQTFGFMWKERAVAYVDDGGAMMDTCGDSGMMIHEPKSLRIGGRATFYAKGPKKFIEVGVLYSDKKLKKPEREINDFFRYENNSKWPVIVMQDMRMTKGSLETAHKYGFHSGLHGSKENLWYRKAGVSLAQHINLFKRFSDTHKKEIEKEFEGITPLMADFSFNQEEGKDLAATVVSKKAKTAKNASKPKRHTSSSD